MNVQCAYCDKEENKCVCGMVRVLQGLYGETEYSGIIRARE